MLDTPNKALLAGAAAAFVSIIAVYLFVKHKEYSQQAEWSARVTRERAALLQFIGGDDSEDNRLRNVCVQARNILNNSPENREAQRRVASCRVIGY